MFWCLYSFAWGLIQIPLWLLTLQHPSDMPVTPAALRTTLHGLCCSRSTKQVRWMSWIANLPKVSNLAYDPPFWLLVLNVQMTYPYPLTAVRKGLPRVCCSRRSKQLRWTSWITAQPTADYLVQVDPCLVSNCLYLILPKRIGLYWNPDEPPPNQ